MKRLSQKDPCGQKAKRPGPVFRLMEALRESRYRRLVGTIREVDEELEGIRKKEESLKSLERSSREAVAEPDCSNWNDVAARMREMMESREKLKGESVGAVAMLFGKSLLLLGSMGAAIAFTIRLATQEFPNAIAMAVGGVIIAAAATLSAWVKHDACSPDYLAIISADLESQRERLLGCRRMLMRRLHGFREHDQ